MNRAVFFDKDGVLNIDKGVKHHQNYVDLFPWSGDIIAEFKSKNFKIFVVTNQPAVARGLITEKDLNNAFKQFIEMIKKQNSEALIDRIYYCPHHPDGIIKEYRKVCNCRKPKPGMLLKAAEEYDVDLKNSIMIGDMESDLIAGRAVGCEVLCVPDNSLL